MVHLANEIAVRFVIEPKAADGHDLMRTVCVRVGSS